MTGSAPIELRVRSVPGAERAAMEVAASVARQMGFPPDRVEDIKTAVAEATLHAITPIGGGDARRKVRIVIAPEVGGLEIDVRNPWSILPRSEALELPGMLAAVLAGEVDTSKARGWGMFLARSLVDEMELASSASGSHVRMVVYLRATPPVV